MNSSAKLKRIFNMGLLDLYRHARSPSLAGIKLRARRDMSVTEVVSFLNVGTSDVHGDDVTALLKEIQLDHAFHAQLNDAFVNTRGRRCALARWHEFLYVYVRVARPAIVILTGVFDGAADAVMLRAMQRNEHGKLVSIDLPAVDAIALSTDAMVDVNLPPGKQPGWLVPDELRQRYDLRLGDSRELLPKALSEHSRIDAFIHDSLHTYDHQLFEYNAAWPHIAEGGMLMSDDVLMNLAWWHFLRKIDRQSALIDGFGVARK
jgi:hypothetical protein